MSGPLAAAITQLNHKPVEPPVELTPDEIIRSLRNQLELSDRRNILLKIEAGALLSGLNKHKGMLEDSRRMYGAMRQEIDDMHHSNQLLLKQLNELWQSKSGSLANQSEQQKDHDQNGHDHQRDLGDTVERLGQRHDVDQVGQQPKDQPDNDQIDDQIDERLDHGRIP
jgi:5-bromo-4-chloroindolyl phosphate hydrolysis protein